MGVDFTVTDEVIRKEQRGEGPSSVYGQRQARNGSAFFAAIIASCCPFVIYPRLTVTRQNVGSTPTVSHVARRLRPPISVRPSPIAMG
jgi:hypothetical protein